MDRQAFRERVNACTACPLHKTRTQAVPGTGPEDAEIMLIGEKPSVEDNNQGQPFVGSAGQLLTQLLSRAELNRTQLYITTAVKCHPPANRPPTNKEIAACAPWLHEELTAVQPKLILGLGASAVKTISTAKSIKEARGKQLTKSALLDGIDAAVMGTVDPAAYFHTRSNAVLTNIVGDLQLAVASLRGEDPEHPAPPRRDVLVLPSEIDGTAGLAALSWLERAKAFTVDCEWTAPKDGLVWPWSPGAQLYSVALSGVINGVIESVGLAFPQPPVVVSLLEKLLTDRPVVCHNAIADLTWLTGALGIRPQLYADTMVLSYLLDETTAHGLEALATRLCGIPAWKRPLWAAPPENDDEWRKLLQYNCDDTYATLLIHRVLLEQIRALPDDERQALLRLHNRLIIPSLPAYVEMALTGVGINAHDLALALHEQTELLHDAEQRLGDALGKPAYEAAKIPPSPKQSLDVLHQHGIMVPSTGKPVIEPLADRYPLIQSILDVRRKNKLITTYIRPWLGLLERQGTNRLHSIYKPLGTRTGRASAEMEGKGNGGSIHQMPRNTDSAGEESFKIRSMVIPAAGNVIVGGDASQIELRIAAWLANERTMIRLYAQNKDIHRITAAMVAGIPEDKVTKEQRQRAKAVNFGFLYGMGAERFVPYAWIQYKQRYTLEEAQRVRQSYFKLYRDLPRWHAQMASIAANEQRISTPFGRIYRDVTTPQDAANWPVQGTAGMLVQLTTLYFEELLIKNNLRQHVKLILTVHDSIACETPPRFAPLVKLLMEEAFKYPPTERLGISLAAIPVPFFGEVGIGETWSRAA